MDDYILEQVFRFVIKIEWEIYRQFKLASKLTGAIADLVLQDHPVPESLLPDWQGNKLFKKIKRVQKRTYVDQDMINLFSPRDRFCQTITLPTTNLPVIRNCYLEAIVFKTDVGAIMLIYNGIPLILYPNDRVIWLSFLPVIMLPFTRLQIHSENCEVDLIWHEYEGDKAWDEPVKFCLGPTTFSTNVGMLSKLSQGRNWLSIYPNVISYHRSAYKKHCLEILEAI